MSHQAHWVTSEHRQKKCKQVHSFIDETNTADSTHKSNKQMGEKKQEPNWRGMSTLLPPKFQWQQKHAQFCLPKSQTKQCQIL